MIAGRFTNDGLPIIECTVSLPRFGLSGQVTFLVDTGSDTTILHPDAAGDLGCPFDLLDNPAEFISAGGALLYYIEPAVLSFNHVDGGTAEFVIDISVAKPDPVTDDLASLLGRDVLNQVRMEYDFPRGSLALHQE
ncbi:MAG: aspartyl protease family protein [Chloroflexota bacterium]|nr:aspartyl protease family protein [Chloroflexota bacterium]MDE2961178.1 aspartyl protease family protein [Chloroflexota bacterium]